MDVIPAAVSGYDCDGICLIDTDGDGVCDEFEISGCTDATACNYNASNRWWFVHMLILDMIVMVFVY